MANVVQHPAAKRRAQETEKRLKDVCGRWIQFKEQHRRCCDLLWAGMLSQYFTQDELALIPSMLSERDRQLLRRMRGARSVDDE